MQPILPFFVGGRHLVKDAGRLHKTQITFSFKARMISHTRDDLTSGKAAGENFESIKLFRKTRKRQYYEMRSCSKIVDASRFGMVQVRSCGKEQCDNIELK